jgi:prostamide/prostaglandin F2alpha synthase
MMKKLVTGRWFSVANQAKSKGISGDLKGDAYQNGGTLIVDKNGKQLYEYRQEDAAEHISVDEILKALKIDNPNASTQK